MEMQWECTFSKHIHTKTHFYKRHQSIFSCLQVSEVAPCNTKSPLDVVYPSHNKAAHYILGPWTMSSSKVSTSSCKLEGRPSWHLLCIALLLSCNLQFRLPFEQAMSSFITAVCWSLTRCQDRERSYGQKTKKKRFIQETSGSRRHTERESLSSPQQFPLTSQLYIAIYSYSFKFKYQKDVSWLVFHP